MAEQEDDAAGSKRRCVFCGGKGLTKEHVWPAWLAKATRAQAKLAHHVSWSEVQDHVRERSPFTAPPFTATVRRVCATCNHGWIHDLEDRVRPILLPMLEGRGRTLYPATRKTLALWAWKTVMMFELASSDSPRAIPDEH